MSLVKHAGQVATPIAPGPAQALTQELGVVLESSLDFTFWVILHVRLPAVGHHPPRDKIIVISIELILPEPPFLVCEAARELLILQDVCTVSGCSP